MNSTRKPLPAYAKELAERRRRGMTLRDPTVSVRLSGFRRPGIGYGVLIRDDTDPLSLQWSWARGLEVLVFYRGEGRERLTSALTAIESACPRRLLVIDLSQQRIISVADRTCEVRRAS